MGFKDCPAEGWAIAGAEAWAIVKNVHRRERIKDCLRLILMGCKHIDNIVMTSQKHADDRSDVLHAISELGNRL